MNCIAQETLDQIFPPERTNAFFDAIYGDVEEGAYDINLVCEKISTDRVNLAFELRRRQGKCLKCSLTYGLPTVFARHPLINATGIAKTVAEKLGWHPDVHWHLDATREISDDLHSVPFVIEKA